MTFLILIGVVFLAIGSLMFYWPEKSNSIIKSLYSHKQTIFLVGFFEVVIGISIFNKADLWKQVWFGSLLDFFGWYLAIEGVLYFFLSEKIIQKIPDLMQNKIINIIFSLFYVFSGIALLYAVILVKR